MNNKRWQQRLCIDENITKNEEKKLFQVANYFA